MLICAIFAQPAQSFTNNCAILAQPICIQFTIKSSTFVTKNKNMRRFILFFLGVIFFLPLCAEEEPIPIYDTSGKHTPITEQPNERRSFTFEPTATHEGNIIHIYYYSTEQLHITVTDAEGNTIYENETWGDCTFVLNGEAQGVFTLLLETETNTYEGVFDL